MLTTQQIQQLQPLESRWMLWKQSHVSLFTHEDKLKIDEVRLAIGLPAANINCHACFIADITAIMIIYDQQQSSDTTTQQAAGTGRKINTDK